MRRKLAVMFLMGMLVVALGACGSSDGDDNTLTDTTSDVSVDTSLDVVEEDLVAEDLVAEDLAQEDLAVEDLTVEDLTVEDLTVDDLAEVTEPDVVEDVEPADVPEETVTPVDEFAVLIEYLEGENGNFINTLSPKITLAADVVAGGLESWIILDIRDKDKYGPDADGNWIIGANGVADYEDGHIPGAISVVWTDIVTFVKENYTKDDKLLIVCYTGQTAGLAVLALNLLGYDAWSMKWGMSAWNAKFDVWTPSLSSDYTDQFTTDADTGKNEAGDYPVLDTGMTTGEEILAARIDAVLAAGVSPIVTPAAFFAASDDYYTVNYWSEAEYLNPGHIIGSHQYTPKVALSTTADLATLPTDQPIAVYCYSGQNGAQVAMWLTILGYDAWSIMFGTNGMFYDSMIAQQWVAPGEYEFETGAAE